MLAINSETVDSTRVGRDVLLMPATKFLDEIADKSVVKVLTKVGMACNDLDYKDTQMETSQFPPPRSKMKTLRSPVTYLSRP